MIIVFIIGYFEIFCTSHNNNLANVWMGKEKVSNSLTLTSIERGVMFFCAVSSFNPGVPECVLLHYKPLNGH